MIDVIFLLIFCASAFYLWLKFIYSFWQRKNFPYIKPSIPFGNLSAAAKQKSSLGINIYNLHKNSKEPFVGIYLLFRPALLMRDADLVKDILTTNFASFHDRGVYHNPKDPVTDHLFKLPGQSWKNLRAKLTPTFTSGRLKGMLPAIIQLGQNLTRQLAPMAEQGKVVEMKDLLTRYALDVIGTVGFGLDVNTIADPKHSFREIERQINNDKFINRIRSICAFLCPEVLELFQISSMSGEFKDFMIQIVKDTMEYREKNNVTRKDFIQLLMQLRKTGNISSEDNAWDGPNDVADNHDASNNEFKSMSIEQCAAQVALFYLAGFDTTSSAISCCLFELSRNPDLMKRLQNDIDKALEKHSGEITYDYIQEIPLLDWCVMESVRMYPTLPLLNRVCTKDYRLPNSDLTVKTGTHVVISLLGIMRDPEYFPDPEKFIPDRYSKEKANYLPAAYIPFGEGPRTCIGKRMGQIVAKVALIMLLQRYNFECLDTRDLEFDNHSVALILKGGINLRVTNRNSVPDK